MTFLDDLFKTLEGASKGSFSSGYSTGAATGSAEGSPGQAPGPAGAAAARGVDSLGSGGSRRSSAGTASAPGVASAPKAPKGPTVQAPGVSQARPFNMKSCKACKAGSCMDHTEKRIGGVPKVPSPIDSPTPPAPPPPPPSGGSMTMAQKALTTRDLVIPFHLRFSTQRSATTQTNNNFTALKPGQKPELPEDENPRKSAVRAFEERTQYIQEVRKSLQSAANTPRTSMWWTK